MYRNEELCIDITHIDLHIIYYKWNIKVTKNHNIFRSLL